jgi:hypothetical protein
MTASPCPASGPRPGWTAPPPCWARWHLLAQDRLSGLGAPSRAVQPITDEAKATAR